MRVRTYGEPCADTWGRGADGHNRRQRKDQEAALTSRIRAPVARTHVGSRGEVCHGADGESYSVAGVEAAHCKRDVRQGCTRRLRRCTPRIGARDCHGVHWYGINWGDLGSGTKWLTIGK